MIDTSLTSSNFYFLIAVIQGFILSLIIILQKPYRKPHMFLGVLIFLFSLSLLHLLLEESIHAFNADYPIPMEFSFSYGPLAYFHVLSIKSPKRPFKLRDTLHFLPTILFDAILFTTFFIYVRFNREWALGQVELIQTIALIMALTGLIQLGIYTWMIYRESNTAHAMLKDFQTIRHWLRYLIIAWCIIISFLIIAVPIALFFIDQFDEHSYFVYKPLGFLIGLCIYVLGYLYLLKYKKIVSIYIERLQKFKFTPSDLVNKKQQILDALSVNKLYQDPNITVAKVAQHLNWPINDLSSAVNETVHTNFNDLINKYRIDAFKEKVLEPNSSKYSILGLAKEVGFNSKASFYRAFKKETGMTPSEFLKSQN